jgi:hypothetical protein
MGMSSLSYGGFETEATPPNKAYFAAAKVVCPFLTPNQ